MFSRRGLCVGLKIYFCKPIGLLDLVVRMCFLGYLEWTNSQYLQTVLAHYLCTSLFFLPFFPEKVILQKFDIWHGNRRKLANGTTTYICSQDPFWLIQSLPSLVKCLEHWVVAIWKKEIQIFVRGNKGNILYCTLAIRFIKFSFLHFLVFLFLNFVM
jgi:hypothetical protein